MLALLPLDRICRFQLGAVRTRIFTIRAAYIMSSKDLRLLALDSGGVRGMSALMILEQLMEACCIVFLRRSCVGDYKSRYRAVRLGSLLTAFDRKGVEGQDGR